MEINNKLKQPIMEIYDPEILSKAMWEMYNIMKNDNFKFEGYSTDDIDGMINHILPYFEKIEEYKICEELKNTVRICFTQIYKIKTHDKKNRTYSRLAY